MDKRGQEKFLSGWNVVVWVILGTVLFVAVVLYNGTQTDSRRAESRILHQKVSDCLLDDSGQLQVPLDDSFDLYTWCGINPSLFEEEYVMYVGLFLRENSEQLFTQEYGNADLYFRCQLDDYQGDNAVCFQESYDVGAQRLTVITASNYFGEVRA